MLYISPFSLLRQGGNVLRSEREIKLAKQKYLAEFDLTGNESIKINGQDLCRNDILVLFAKLQQPDTLHFDSVVAAAPALRLFLEHAEIRPGAGFHIPDHEMSDDFIAWISPYFSRSFRKLTTRAFRNGAVMDFEILMAVPRLMTKDDEWNAWNSVETIVKGQLAAFEKIGNFHPPEQREKYTGHSTIRLLALLPYERFSELQIKYAYQIVTLAVSEFNKGNWRKGQSLIKQAKPLAALNSYLDFINATELQMRKYIRKNTLEAIGNILVLAAILLTLQFVAVHC